MINKILIQVPIFKNAKKEAIIEKFKPPKRIIFDEIKKKEIAGRDMPDIELASRRLRYCNPSKFRKKIIIICITYYRYLRSKSLPPNPRKDEPFFDVHVTFFPPDFYQGAVFAGQGTNKARHLLFFTPIMKRQLEDCKTWFMDSTFHFMRLPFTQVKL